MTPAFDALQQVLKRLPGLGYRSAERLALHLLVERPERLDELLQSLEQARGKVRRCEVCGNLAESARCAICEDPRRDPAMLCIVEQVPDLAAMERTGMFSGRYHVLHGKLAPLQGVREEHLNLGNLRERLADPQLQEVILALSNDIEGEATCHLLRENYLDRTDLKISRIGFGLPSGGGLNLADAGTLRNALEGRRRME